MSQQSEKYLFPSTPEKAVLYRDLFPIAQDIESLIQVTDGQAAQITDLYSLGNYQYITKNTLLDSTRSVVYVNSILLLANFTNKGIVRII